MLPDEDEEHEQIHDSGKDEVIWPCEEKGQARQEPFLCARHNAVKQITSSSAGTSTRTKKPVV